MKKIPRPALFLACILLVPFLLGAAVVFPVGETISSLILRIFNQVSGPFLLVGYGKLVCVLSAGALFGFAAKSRKREWRSYFLAALPLVWVVFTVSDSLEQQLAALIIGFVLVLVADFQFRFWKLTPVWWISFRVPFTLVIIACLGVGFLA